VTCKKTRAVRVLFYLFFLDNFFRVFHRRISSTYGGKGIGDIGVYTKAKAFRAAAAAAAVRGGGEYGGR